LLAKDSPSSFSQPRTIWSPDGDDHFPYAVVNLRALKVYSSPKAHSIAGGTGSLVPPHPSSTVFVGHTPQLGPSHLTAGHFLILVSWRPFPNGKCHPAALHNIGRRNATSNPPLSQQSRFLHAKKKIGGFHGRYVSGCAHS